MSGALQLPAWMVCLHVAGAALFALLFPVMLGAVAVMAVRERRRKRRIA